VSLAVRRLLLGGLATLLAAALLSGSVGAVAKVLDPAAAVSSPARLGLLRIAPGAGSVDLAPARPIAAAEECLEPCGATPRPEVAAAIVVAARGDAKKGSDAPLPAEAPVASSVSPPEVVETEPPQPEPQPQPEPEPQPQPEPEPQPQPEPEPQPEPPVEVEEPEPPPVETSEPPADSGCPLEGSQSSGPIAMSVLGCALVASDGSTDPDPLPFWGSVQCADESRYAYSESGGDGHPSASGEAADAAYRRLTVLDGDDFFGERCELGENDYRTGPTAFYHEGQHRVTYFSERLPANFPLATTQWQTVMQMKQAQPSDDDGSGPALEMEARSNHWVVVNSWDTVWEFPARRSLWTRFAWDVYYSQDAAQGWIQVSADLNGDGDFADAGERSPTIRGATLKTEVEGPSGSAGGLNPGDPIPSHLRIGIYHDPEISCAAPVECSVDVDNVQVVEPSP
jgi:hypothetical protein